MFVRKTKIFVVQKPIIVCISIDDFLYLHLNEFLGYLH